MSKNAFTNLLNAPADEEIVLPVAPVGSWRMTVRGSKLYEPKDEDSAGKLLMFFKLAEPQEDVDADEVTALGEKVEEISIAHTFWLRDKRDTKKLQNFLKTAGAELGGRSLIEAAQSIEGYEIIGYLEQDPDKNDPEVVYNRVTSFAPVA